MKISLRIFFSSNLGFLPLLALLLIFAASVVAQSQIPVTQDDVDAVASRMYCPVCENEPLDACYNPTCIQWKNEIGNQLAAGRNPDEIIAYFVNTYGEHVVGVPQGGFLRTLAFAAPILGTILALAIGIFIMLTWQKQSNAKIQEFREEIDISNDESYRSQIERDLS